MELVPEPVGGKEGRDGHHCDSAREEAESEAGLEAVFPFNDQCERALPRNRVLKRYSAVFLFTFIRDIESYCVLNCTQDLDPGPRLSSPIGHLDGNPGVVSTLWYTVVSIVTANTGMSHIKAGSLLLVWEESPASEV